MDFGGFYYLILLFVSHLPLTQHWLLRRQGMGVQVAAAWCPWASYGGSWGAGVNRNPLRSPGIRGDPLRSPGICGGSARPLRVRRG